MAETATVTATEMMLPLLPTALMTIAMAIRGRQLDNGYWTTTMGWQWCKSTMTMTTAMVEMATTMATAMATVMATVLPLPTRTMLMKTMAAIWGWQLDNNNLMKTMRQQLCTSMLMVTMAMAETATAMATATAMVTAIMPPPSRMAKISMKTTAAI
jgi:hypothetical protein